MEISIDNLAKEVISILDEYNNDVTKQVKEAVTLSAAHALNVVKDKSPQKSGDYKKGWCLTTNYDGKNDRRITLHNRKKPQLTHLLENGYEKQNGGRVQGTPHISTAENEAVDILEKKVEEILQK